MTMKNSFSQETPKTPVIGNVTGSTMPKQADATTTSPENTPAYEIDNIQLFEKAFTLTISKGNSFFTSPNFWIEVEENDVYQSVLINVGDDQVVFYARRLNNAPSPSQKLKVLCLRPGKWAQYFLEVFYPSEIVKSFEKFDDADVDYAAIDADYIANKAQYDKEGADDGSMDSESVETPAAVETPAVDQTTP